MASVELFAALGTQWHAGSGGLIGLRYEAVYPLLDRRCKTEEEWNATFSDVRHMESVALEQMNQPQ